MVVVVKGRTLPTSIWGAQIIVQTNRPTKRPSPRPNLAFMLSNRSKKCYKAYAMANLINTLRL